MRLLYLYVYPYIIISVLKSYIEMMEVNIMTSKRISIVSSNNLRFYKSSVFLWACLMYTACG